jgi:pimeloyl-ACP methyl ester carboxylesterase
MDVAYHEANNQSRSRVLLVMLPGVGFAPDDFVARGFVAAVHECGLAVDVAVAQPGLDAYLDNTLATDLHRDIAARYRSDGDARVWLLGVSLGGMGALLYAQAYAPTVEGVILIAPFLGTAGLVSEVARAGGLASWQPGDMTANDSERLLLGWLKLHTAAPQVRPRLYLGYARGDRFVQGHALLADRLPSSQVVVEEGGHDWDAWTRLWQKIVDKEPFSTDSSMG